MGDFQYPESNDKWAEEKGFLKYCPKHDYRWSPQIHGSRCPKCKVEEQAEAKRRPPTGRTSVPETAGPPTVAPPSGKITSVDQLKMEVCPRCHEKSMSRIKVKWECFNRHCRLRTPDPKRAGLVDRLIAFLARMSR